MAMKELLEEFRELMEELSDDRPALYERLLDVLERIRKQYEKDCEQAFDIAWMFPPWMLPELTQRRFTRKKRRTPRRRRTTGKRRTRR